MVNVWLGSEVRSHDLGNTGAGIGGGAETGSCDISVKVGNPLSMSVVNIHTATGVVYVKTF